MGVFRIYWPRDWGTVNAHVAATTATELIMQPGRVIVVLVSFATVSIGQSTARTAGRAGGGNIPGRLVNPLGLPKPNVVTSVNHAGANTPQGGFDSQRTSNSQTAYGIFYCDE